MINADMLEKLLEDTEEEKAILAGKHEVDKSLYEDKRRNVISSKKFLDEGKLITLRKHTRYIGFPAHTHDYIEVMYMVQGKTTHIVNGDTIELKAGELLFMSCNTTQAIETCGREDIGVNFIILPEFFDKTLPLLENDDSPLKRFVIESLKGEHGMSSYLHFKVGDVLPIQNLLENLIWLLVNDAKGTRLIKQNTMGLLLMHLMSNTDHLKFQNPDQKLKMEILEYIEENYVDGSLEELSQEIHYDFSMLSKLIKQRFGKNYTELVQEKRLAQAEFLLLSTNMSVADIGVKVGYENTSYFYRIFQKLYGQTPKQYRKTFKI